MARADLLQGTLDMMILKSLRPGALHGYDIARAIQSSSADVLRVEEGALYPALHRMEERGWIRGAMGLSANNRRARFYSLTRAGHRQLDEAAAEWDRLATAVTRVMRTA